MTLRYLTVALLIRTADAGAVVALLAGAASRHLSASAGGVLVALLTLPHLLGPALAQPLARTGNPGAVLAGSFAGFGIALLGCGVCLEHRWAAATGAAAVAAGCCGPLVTGGLSSQAHHGSPRPGRAARRADALDAATYAVAGTAGPGIVGVLTAAAGQRWTFPALAALAVAAATATAVALPRPSAAAAFRARTGPAAAVAAVLRTAPLARTLMATCGAALGTGGLLVSAAGLTSHLGGAPVLALVAASMGAGSLLGSLTLAVRPLRREPETTTHALTAVTGLLVAACALAPDAAAAALAFALVGAVSSAQFAASLSVRAAYAPSAVREHVYVTMAGLKMGCASAGAALAGALVAVGARVALLSAGTLILAAAATARLMARVGSAGTVGPRHARADRALGRSQLSERAVARSSTPPIIDDNC